MSAFLDRTILVTEPSKRNKEQPTNVVVEMPHYDTPRQEKQSRIAWRA